MARRASLRTRCVQEGVLAICLAITVTFLHSFFPEAIFIVYNKWQKIDVTEDKRHYIYNFLYISIWCCQGIRLHKKLSHSLKVPSIVLKKVLQPNTNFLPWTAWGTCYLYHHISAPQLPPQPANTTHQQIYREWPWKGGQAAGVALQIPWEGPSHQPWRTGQGK